MSEITVGSADAGSPTVTPANLTTPSSSESSSTDGSSPPGSPASQSESKRRPWQTLGYEQVPGLANRIIARFLRGQRKNMRRFFAERGMLDQLDRMNQIKRSRQGMLAKNRMFQEVLSDYAAAAMGTAAQPATEAPHTEAAGDADVGVHAPAESGGSAPVLDLREGTDAAPGIRGVAEADRDEPVIEE